MRDEVPSYRTYELVVDSVESHAIASWWADVFGVEAGHEASHEGDRSVLEGVPGMPFEA